MENKYIEKTFNNRTLKIRTKIPSREIYELIEGVIADSKVNNIINPYLMDVYFHARFYLLTVDVIPTEDELKDIFLFYDKIKNDGSLAFVVSTISDLYQYVFENCIELKDAYEKYAQSLAYGLIAMGELSTKLNQDLEETKEKINNFDFEKVEEVVNFKKAIDGSSDNSTNA